MVLELKEQPVDGATEKKAPKQREEWNRNMRASKAFRKLPVTGVRGAGLRVRERRVGWQAVGGSPTALDATHFLGAMENHCYGPGARVSVAEPGAEALQSQWNMQVMHLPRNSQPSGKSLHPCTKSNHDFPHCPSYCSTFLFCFFVPLPPNSQRKFEA